MNEQLQNELEEQARLLGMSAERECDLLGELERERALADRLARLLQLYFWKYEVTGYNSEMSKALSAWKEARSE